MRLIDADALSEKLCETTIFIKDGEVFQRMINDAPTIEPDGDLISRQAVINVLEERLRANGYSNVALVSELNRSVGYLMRLPSATSQNLAKPNKSCEGDLISREEVLNMIIVAGECEPDLGYTHLHSVIESLPSAEPKTDGVLEQVRWERDWALKTLEDHGIGLGQKPKTGEWIWKDRHIKRTRQVKGITADGEETVVSVHEDYIEQRPYCSECGKWNDSDYSNYCPNCGSFNGGEEE